MTMPADESASGGDWLDETGADEGADRVAKAAASEHAPSRGSRLTLGLVRVMALVGVVGVGVALAAILVSQGVAGWIAGLVISVVVELLTMFVLFSKRFSSRPEQRAPRRAR